MPVHLYGGCADMDPIMEIARSRGCTVIEDGAQSIGAEYKGRAAQSIGDIGCISFFPSKNLGGFGDGGMVLTQDEALAKKLAALRVHGASKKYFHDWVGINSRLDTLQAAVLRVKLQYLDDETAWTAEERRPLSRESGRRGSADRTLPSRLSTRRATSTTSSSSARRSATSSRRISQENGIGTEIYYPLSLHQQVCFGDLGYRTGDFPESEKAADEVLAVPVHSALSEQDVDYVCQQIRAFFA